MTDSDYDYSDDTPEDILERIATARILRKQDELEESQELLLALLEEYPDQPLVLFEVGGSYDVMGEEEQAIPYYRNALKEGLVGDDRQECLVCLGSTLRIVGQIDEAITTLQRAINEYPDRPSAKVFLALAQLDDGEENDAMATLLDVILEASDDPDIKAYAGAIEYYRDELRGELD